MKIVVLDGHALNPGDLSWDFLKEYGEVKIYDRTPIDKIVERAHDADIIITNKVPIKQADIDLMENLCLVAVTATGYNICDTAYLRSKNIPVVNVPAYSTEAVAQMVFAYMLSWCNSVTEHSTSVHAGEWTSSPDFAYWKTPLYELNGKKLGIIGYGRIGKSIAKKAESFNMEVLCNTPHPPTESNINIKFVKLEDLITNSDFITLHCPLTDKTEKLVNASFLEKMKSTAYLINTSRGPVIDEYALADALNSDKIAGAAVDVLSTEPPLENNPLLTAKNCIITPHVAWAGYETRVRLMEILKQNIASFINGYPINVVNA